MVQTGRGKVQTQNDTAKFTAGKAECGAVATCGSEVECSAYCPWQRDQMLLVSPKDFVSTPQ